MKKQKKNHVEMWVCINACNKNPVTNVIVLDEQGRSHFMYSSGDWDTALGLWKREEMVRHGIEFCGTL